MHQEISRAKEKNYQKIQNNIIKKAKTLQLNAGSTRRFGCNTL